MRTCIFFPQPSRPKIFKHKVKIQIRIKLGNIWAEAKTKEQKQKFTNGITSNSKVSAQQRKPSTI